MKWVVGACATACGIVLGCQPIRLDPPPQVALEDAEDALETAYCERMFSCSCEEGRVFASVDECMQHVRSEIAALEQQPGGKGIFYDPYCLGEKVAAFDELGCAAEADDDDSACARPCLIYHGDVREGESCHATADGIYSDCTKRMRCKITDCSPGPEAGCRGFCVDPCEHSADGSPCGGPCDVASYCDEDVGACVPRPGLAGLDEACSGHSQCQSGFCPAGRCAALPEEGDSCADASTCAAGSRCDLETSTCLADDALLCTMLPEIR